MIITMGCVSSQILPDVYEDKKPQDKKSKNQNVMRGDISLKTEAKLKREKSMRERMHRRTVDAEEMSGKIMEEKERLSLGTWSHATSRETSRTASPVGFRRQVHFLPDEKDDCKVKGKGKGKKLKNNKVANGDAVNVTISVTDSQLELNDENGGIKNHNNNSNSQSKYSNANTTDLNAKSLGTIEERTSSRSSEKVELESKRG